jgi:SAM-dependent methyltransferase
MRGVQAAVRALQPEGGGPILDAGCGTGLTVRAYARPELQIFALDLSLISLGLLGDRAPADSVVLVRGDLGSLPFPDCVFQRVLCANAVQHLPTEPLRRSCIRELARVVRPGGRVVVSTHNYSIPKRWSGWRKEGTPGGGTSGPVQYIYRSEHSEFRELLASHLNVKGVYGVGLPLPYKWRLSPLSCALERVLSRLQLMAPWGHMLIGVAQKRF